VEWFKYGSGLAVIWDPGIKLAMLGRPDQPAPERFGALVARNRGLHHGFYTDEAEAMAWLLAGPPPGAHGEG
jgi:hypothetical protein